ncbi:cytochrome P450 [Streptomyces sp. SD11]|uniref:cytochrome P450 n=1 Tax=Streptomyces sp. SD11 TaxID=3452209 RepID=UPI003F88D1F4
MTTSTQQDPFILDAIAADVHGDAQRLRALGPLVEAVLSDSGLKVLVCPDRDVAERILGDRETFRKNPEHWTDLRDGLVPQGGIMEFATMPGMLNADGAEHRKLRGLVSDAFTARRVENLRPRVEEIVQSLLGDVAAAATTNGFLELRRRFAFELPMQILTNLFGLDPDSGEVLARNYTAIHASTTAEASLAGKAGVLAVIADLIEAKRRHPADDLTSALIAATDGQDAALDDELLVATLMLFLFAGQATTADLIVNCLKALADHPGELAHVRAGVLSVEDVVKEVLRWNGPIQTIMFRYPVRDVVVPGTDVLVKKGRAIAIHVAATGRDERAYGADAATFDPSRDTDIKKHLAFGYGVHYCMGAPLALMMTTTAVAQLIERFDLDRTGAPTSRPISSFSPNSDAELWMRLSARTTAPAAA